jgi:DNA invertase Pin-like site-specific DNA recombinase
MDIAMGKVLAHHLARKACVYVRQSSLAQVRHHRESGRRQRDFKDRAAALGWRVEQVEVIDEDQGRSGSSTEGRAGFKRLLGEVGLGEVGAVFGLEVSRLARSCADWYRLLEIAAITRTLIVDEEGVYDPNHYNDRLLLGLKGTLSEAELHFLKQRMVGGRRNKARRAAFRIRLPAGYLWEEGIVLDPDERVQGAITLFFETFERLGTAMAVARHFEDCRQPFPRRDGWGSPDVAPTWGKLSHSRTVAVLKNPTYAGIYAYDRHHSEEMDPEDPCSGGRILIPDSHPGYITEYQYERNVARLVSNRSHYRGMRQKGSAREGSCLLTGIALCGRCGRRMNPLYHSRTTPLYACYTAGTKRPCESVHARHLDPTVEEVILDTISKEGLSLAVGAMEKLAERSMALERQWQKRLEAVRYEAARASRRYHQVEPENRLVVRTLEREWNESLQNVAQVEAAYEEARRAPPIALTAEQREQVLALSKDLPRLFRAPTSKVSQKKEILRLLIEDVTLTNQDDPWAIEVAIRWKTGAVSRHRAERPKRNPQTTSAEVIERIKALYQVMTDEETAEALNREGFTSSMGRPFTVCSVAHLRRSRGWVKRRRKG